jgi:fucose permease
MLMRQTKIKLLPVKGRNSLKNITFLQHCSIFALAGGLSALPGTNMLSFLANANWGPGQFGTGLLLQGVFAFLGAKSVATPLVQNVPTQKKFVLFSVVQLTAVFLNYSSHSSDILRYLGFAFFGFTIGFGSLMGSRSAVGEPKAQRLLNILNLSFTAGALAVPLFAALFGFLLPHWEGRWRSPLALVAALHIMLWFLILSNKESEKVNQHTSDAKVIHNREHPKSLAVRLPLLAASFGLLLYVGNEINMANTWVGLAMWKDAFSPSAAQWMSAFFWAGLFATRLFFSLWVPTPQSVFSWLITFAFGTLAWVGIFAFWVFFGNPNWVWVPWTCAFGSGLFIGASYSFFLGAAVQVAPEGQKEKFAQKTAEFGVLGAILLPPLMGYSEEWSGKQAVLVFLLVAVFLQCVCATLLKKRDSFAARLPKLN